jgi:hypothetical protein
MDRRGVVVVCGVPPAGRLFLAVGFAGFWICILFCSEVKKKLIFGLMYALSRSS